MLDTLAILLALAANDPLDVTGRWVIPAEEEGGPTRGTVEIVMEEGAPVGRIVEVGEVFAETPEAEGAIGTTVLWDFERDEDEWDDGKILDPEADRTYGAKIHREGDTLSVKGCIAFFCQSQVWQPAAAE